jgi:hypothetical protein
MSSQHLLRIVPIILLIGYLTAIHMVTHGIPRYRLPLEPFLIVLAGFSLTEIVHVFTKHARSSLGLKSLTG